MSTIVAPVTSPTARVREAVELPETAPPVERLFHEPQKFDFFQAVRLLEQLQPGRRAVGNFASPEDETVRFASAMGTAFPASSITDLAEAVEDTTNPAPPTMTVAFMGLTGPSGALPSHYTEMLWRLQRDVRTAEKQAVRDWFDLFNHRLVSLFHRAWEKYRPLVAYERGDYQQGSPDTFTQGLLSFAGLNRRGANDDAHLPPAYRLPRALVYYAGLLAQRPRNVSNLQAILRDFFALPFDILQFQGEWTPLACDQQTQLGICGTLGADATVGPRVWNRQGKIRIRIGPLTSAQFEQLLPCHEAAGEGTPHLGEIVAVTRFYVGTDIDFDIQLVLRHDEVSACQLAEAAQPRLGWNTWLPGETNADRNDAVFGVP